MIWRVNRDEALVLHHDDGRTLGGVWRGAWLEKGEKRLGYLAAVWRPYRRVGRFDVVLEAKRAVREVVGG